MKVPVVTGNIWN